MHQSDNAAAVTALAALIRRVDGDHSMGAAQLAEALIQHGVTIAGQTEQQYAAAVSRDNGTVEPVSSTFGTRAEAEHDLAVLLGDDYYRDRRPFVATAAKQTWTPLEPATFH